MHPPKLRDYQLDCENGVRNSYRSGKKAPILVVPTGGGKTIIMGSITRGVVKKEKRVLINVHRAELLTQTLSKLSWFGVDAGAISPKMTPDYNANVQVAMVQTMIKRKHLYKDFDLIITDECHHVAAKTYMGIFEAYPRAYHLGLTATPIRTDGKGLGINYHGIYDDMVKGPSIRSLIDRGYLVEPSLYVPPSNLDLGSIRRTAGDFNKKQAWEAVGKSNIHGSCVDHYRQYMDGKPAVAFCINIDHAERVASEFRAAGYRAFTVSGKTEDRERKAILDGLATGYTEIVTSCDVISEGTDIPAIAGAFLLRPTQSLSLYLQQVGRTLRTMEGKSEALIFDHVGNSTRHGMVDDDRDWSLEGFAYKKEKEEESVPRVAVCKSCFKAYKWNLMICPFCGAERQIDLRKKKNIEIIDGKLVKLTKEMIAAKRLALKKEEWAAETEEDWNKIAKSRGYHKGWVTHRMRARSNKS